MLKVISSNLNVNIVNKINNDFLIIILIKKSFKVFIEKLIIFISFLL